MYYECDPKKNVKCTGRNTIRCGSQCCLTIHKEYAKKDADALSKEEAIAFDETKENTKKKTNERKEKAVLKDGSVLPIEGMEEVAPTDSDSRSLSMSESSDS